MNFLILGFFTGLSLILAIGAQNIFVIEQGLKRQFTFLVCLVCSVSDFLLIFLGIFLFQYFNDFFTPRVELIFNLLLFIFLIHFIWNKINLKQKKITINAKRKKISIYNIFIKTLAFTYLNPHVYSDTVFFLGNFSKDFTLLQKYYFGIGASSSSILFFFIIGYISQYFSKYLKNKKIWKIINLMIIFFMIFLATLVLAEIFN